MANRVLLAESPSSINALQETIQLLFDAFSPRVQEVADLVMREPMRVATDAVTDLSALIDVPPSTFTRFAKVLGFDSFMQVQALYKTQYVDRPRDYLERIHQAKLHPRSEVHALHEDFAQANVEAIRMTALELNSTKLQTAVALLRDAQEIWIHGVRRAYPVAAYLHYLLLKSGARASVLECTGGFLKPSLARLHKKGVLVVVTYSPHGQESEQAMEAARSVGTPMIALTDAMPSPYAKDMAVRFEIREGEVMGFRALSASMYLAQTLGVMLAQELAG